MEDTSTEKTEPEFKINETTIRNIELMRPEVRELLNLDLDGKIAKTKEIIREAIQKLSLIHI